MAHNKDWREWLESLNASGVEYVVVGGIALAFHGIVRYTGDLDVLVHASAANAERVMLALRRFGFESLKLTEADFAKPDQVVQLGYPPGRIDILTSIPQARTTTRCCDSSAASTVGRDCSKAAIRVTRRQLPSFTQTSWPLDDG